MTLVVVIAITAALALTPAARKLAWKFGAVSRPDGDRRLHARPTALWGGSAVYLAVLMGVAASYRNVPGTWYTVMMLAALGSSSGMLCLLGCIDDYFEIRARWKLFGQIVSTLPVVAVGCYVQQISILGLTVDFGWLGIVGTVGYLVLGINAINLLDGMDGLATIVGIIISVAVAVISAIHGNPEAVLLALALAGALAGFLVYNLPPARIYLGDCGSLVIGLAVSVLVLEVSRTSASTANVTIVAALLFVPLLDTGLAIMRRTLTGQGLMVADRGHVHHRLLDRGFGVWQALAILGGFSLATAGAAWLAAAWGRELWAWVVLAALVTFAVNRRLIGHEEWRLAKAASARLALMLLRQLPAARRFYRPQLSQPTVASPLQGSAPRPLGHLPAEEDGKKAA